MNKKFKDVIYVIENGEVTITKCDKSVTEVVIPSEIEGYPVTSIGEYAFCDCTGLTSVTIPNSVTTICRKAFYGCSGLTSITIPSSVIRIAPLAFRWCSKLSDVRFPTPNQRCRIDCTSGLPLRQCVDGNWRA